VYADLPSRLIRTERTGELPQRDSTFGCAAGILREAPLAARRRRAAGLYTIAPGSAIALRTPTWRTLLPDADRRCVLRAGTQAHRGLIDAQWKPSDSVNLDLSAFIPSSTGRNYNRNYLLWNTHYINFARTGTRSGYVVTTARCAGSFTPSGPVRVYDRSCVRMRAPLQLRQSRW